MQALVSQTETAFAVYEQPLNEDAEYLRVLITARPGTWDIRTSTGQIFNDLMTQLPQVDGYDLQRRKLCHTIVETIYPLIASLFAREATLTLTTTAGPLTPDFAMNAIATYTMFDIGRKEIHHVFVSPYHEAPDARALTISSGLILRCVPENHLAPQSYTGMPPYNPLVVPGLFEWTRRKINEWYEQNQTLGTGPLPVIANATPERRAEEPVTVIEDEELPSLIPSPVATSIAFAPLFRMTTKEESATPAPVVTISAVTAAAENETKPVHTVTVDTHNTETHTPHPVVTPHHADDLVHEMAHEETAHTAHHAEPEAPEAIETMFAMPEHEPEESNSFWPNFSIPTISQILSKTEHTAQPTAHVEHATVELHAPVHTIAPSAEIHHAQVEPTAPHSEAEEKLESSSPELAHTETESARAESVHTPEPHNTPAAHQAEAEITPQHIAETKTELTGEERSPEPALDAIKEHLEEHFVTEATVADELEEENHAPHPSHAEPTTAADEPTAHPTAHTEHTAHEEVSHVEAEPHHAPTHTTDIRHLEIAAEAEIEHQHPATAHTAVPHAPTAIATATFTPKISESLAARAKVPAPSNKMRVSAASSPSRDRPLRFSTDPATHLQSREERIALAHIAGLNNAPYAPGYFRLLNRHPDHPFAMQPQARPVAMQKPLPVKTLAPTDKPLQPKAVLIANASPQMQKAHHPRLHIPAPGLGPNFSGES